MHQAAHEVERIYTTNARAFPIGGRKQKRDVPIGVAGRRVWVMNVSHDAGWFTPEDAEKARVIAAVLAPVLIAREGPWGASR